MLHVESRAARLEAHSAADPALGRLWRSEAALTEAVRSVGLEDVAVREGDLVAKAAENRVTGPDGQGIAAAHDVLRGLQAPGDLVKRPAETLDRLARAGAGGDTARLQRLVASDADPPASAGAADGAAGQGAWVLLPATALSADGFRAWAPLSRQGMPDLLYGLETALDRELGRLGELRHWTEATVPRFTGGPRRGGRRDLVDQLLRQPLVTAPMVAAALDVTGQTARNLVAAAETAGVLVQVTRRDRHRVWATPGLAARLDQPNPV